MESNHGIGWGNENILKHFDQYQTLSNNNFYQHISLRVDEIIIK